MKEPAVVRVGGGRGFVVERRRERVIITAAHCLPKLPPPHPAMYLHERTYKALLAPLGAEPAVWAECLFVDPVGDIAVLGCPDDQELHEQAEAYKHLVGRTTPLTIADAPKQGRETLSPEYGSCTVATPGKGQAQLLSLDGKWIDRPVLRRNGWLSVESGALVSGMSGSPIVMDGKAIALCSVTDQNPVLRDCLPAWFFRRGL
jgi:hypothetical protein